MARRREPAGRAGGDTGGGRFLSAQEAADRLRVHRETVRRWLRAGRMTGVDLGGRGGYRLTEAEVERVAALMAAGQLPEKDSAPGAGGRAPSKTLAA